MIETLKKKPIVKGKKGGPRPGSGRPKGKLDKKTLEKLEILRAYKQRILQNADKLFNAQVALAQGISYLYRVDEVGEGKNKKREHVLVTDPEEIKQVLDETDGAGGVCEDHYYYITTKTPDNKAIDSMLDRVFGKATQLLAGTDDEGNEKPLSVINVQTMTPEQIDQALAEKILRRRKK